MTAVTGCPGGPGRSTGQDGPTCPERSRRRRRPRSRRSVWTSPLVLRGLAATAVFAFVVVGAVYALDQGGSSSSSSSAGPAAGAPAPVRRPGSGGGSGEHSPATFGANNPVYSTTGIALKYNASGKTRTTTVYTSSAHFTRANIARGVRSGFIEGLSLPDAGPAHQPVPTGAHHPQAPQPHKVGSVSVGQIAGCLSAVAPASGVLVVEVAHPGQAAIIVVGKPAAKAYRSRSPVSRAPRPGRMSSLGLPFPSLGRYAGNLARGCSVESRAVRLRSKDT